MGEGGNEAGLEQAVAQEIRDPFAIFDIGFVPRNGMHMLGIDQHDLITAFQQIENGTPRDARDARGPPVSPALLRASGQARLRPLVVVAKVRIDFSTVPFCWLSSRQATTVFLWTSKPQQRSYTTCIRSLLSRTVSACETHDTKQSGERCGRQTHKFLHVLPCITGGDTSLFGTHQDQLRTRVL